MTTVILKKRIDIYIYEYSPWNKQSKMCTFTVETSALFAFETGFFSWKKVKFWEKIYPRKKIVPLCIFLIAQ